MEFIKKIKINIDYTLLLFSAKFLIKLEEFRVKIENHVYKMDDKLKNR